MSKFSPPEWPDPGEWFWVKFKDRKPGTRFTARANPQGHEARADGAYKMWFSPGGQDRYPEFRIESGWYWPYYLDGTPKDTSGEVPEIEWMSRE